MLVKIVRERCQCQEIPDLTIAAPEKARGERESGLAYNLTLTSGRVPVPGLPKEAQLET